MTQKSSKCTTTAESLLYIPTHALEFRVNGTYDPTKMIISSGEFMLSWFKTLWLVEKL